VLGGDGEGDLVRLLMMVASDGGEGAWIADGSASMRNWGKTSESASTVADE
jgi:hypothetical protein